MLSVLPRFNEASFSLCKICGLQTKFVSSTKVKLPYIDDKSLIARTASRRLVSRRLVS